MKVVVPFVMPIINATIPTPPEGFYALFMSSEGLAVKDSSGEVVTLSSAGTGQSGDALKLGTMVNALDYITSVSDTSDDTAGLNQAIDTGKHVWCPAGVYRITQPLHNLNEQCLFGSPKSYGSDYPTAYGRNGMGTIFIVPNGASGLFGKSMVSVNSNHCNINGISFRTYDNIGGKLARFVKSYETGGDTQPEDSFICNCTFGGDCEIGLEIINGQGYHLINNTFDAIDVLMSLNNCNNIKSVGSRYFGAQYTGVVLTGGTCATEFIGDTFDITATWRGAAFWDDFECVYDFGATTDDNAGLLIENAFDTVLSGARFRTNRTAITMKAPSKGLLGNAKIQGSMGDDIVIDGGEEVHLSCDFSPDRYPWFSAWGVDIWNMETVRGGAFVHVKGSSKIISIPSLVGVKYGAKTNAVILESTTEKCLVDNIMAPGFATPVNNLAGAVNTVGRVIT